MKFQDEPADPKDYLPQSTEPRVQPPTFDSHAVRGYHPLVIPVEGFYHLYHSDEPFELDYIKKVLAQFNRAEVGSPARIEAKIDETEAVVWFVPDPDLPLNDRAREIIADVFGWHMTFWGVVIVDGLDADTTAKIVSDYE